MEYVNSSMDAFRIITFWNCAILAVIVSQTFILPATFESIVSDPAAEMFLKKYLPTKISVD